MTDWIKLSVIGHPDRWLGIEERDLVRNTTINYLLSSGSHSCIIVDHREYEKEKERKKEINSLVSRLEDSYWRAKAWFFFRIFYA